MRIAAESDATPANNLAGSENRGNIGIIIAAKKSTTMNTMNMRHAVRHGRALRLKITHRQASTSPNVIAGETVSQALGRSHYRPRAAVQYAHTHHLLEFNPSLLYNSEAVKDWS